MLTSHYKLNDSMQRNEKSSINAHVYILKEIESEPKKIRKVMQQQTTG